MAENFLYIPFINPVKFYTPARATTNKYQTKHLDDFPFSERLLSWQTPANYIQVWQVDDIIRLQFESTFDPIIVELLNFNNEVEITLPALIGLPNKYYPNTYSYEVSMSLAGLNSGCYRIQVTAGPEGETQKIYYSNWMYISEEAIENTKLIEYWNTRFHEDVIFETGIKFQLRIFGYFGFLKPGRSEEVYRDERYNPSILSARTYRQFDLFLGDEFGLPDEVIDLINRISGCNNFLIDNKSFSILEGESFELSEVEDYPKRGLKLRVEEGVNRGSKIFSQDTDTNKKLNYGIVVDAKVWGDTSNQGSSNTVPIIKTE